MQAVTIKEAKTRLNELVNAAGRGEQVVLMRRSQHVATIVPISAGDIELSARLSDAQADRLWRGIAEERKRKASSVFRSAQAAVRAIKGASPKPVARRTARV